MFCVRGAGGVQTPLSARSMKPEETARQNVSNLNIDIYYFKPRHQMQMLALSFSGIGLNQWDNGLVST